MIKDSLGILVFIAAVIILVPVVLFLGCLFFIANFIHKKKQRTGTAKARKLMINWLYAVDQFGNALMGGHPDETISSRLGRSIGQERYWWVKLARVIVDKLALLFNDPDHCKNSVLYLEQHHLNKSQMEIWSWNKKDTK